MTTPRPGVRKLPAGWRMPGTFGEVLVARSIDVPLDQRDARELGGHGLVDGWLADRWARETALEMVQSLTGLAPRDGWGVAPGSLDASARLVLERALRSGELIVLRLREPAWAPLSRKDDAPAIGPQRPAGVERDEWIDILLFDSAGRPIQGAELVVHRGGAKLGGGATGADGIGRVRGIEPQPSTACTVSLAAWVKRARPLEVHAPPAVLDLDTSRARGPIDGPHRVSARELGAHPQPARLLGTTVFQLARRAAVVIELEHFTENGAVLLPGRSPQPRRDGAAEVTGIEALQAVFDRASGTEPVLVTGHHATLSRERAEWIQLLLMGERAKWAALSARVATPDDEAAIRSWATEPLPAEAGWTQETWERVFELYVKELSPRGGPPALKSHPKIIVRLGKNFVPHVVARDATGSAADYVKMNPVNPTKPIGASDAGWHPTYPNETVWLPDEWNEHVPRLRAAGWDAYPGEPDTPAPPRVQRPARAVGCGDHHLAHPAARAPERRARTRHAEVIFGVDEETLVCSHDAACDTTTCEAYDPMSWDLAYVALGNPVASVTVIVRSQPGNVRVRGAEVTIHCARRVPSQVTEGSGAVTFEGIPLGRADISVKHGDEFAGAQVAVEASKNEVIIDFLASTMWIAELPYGVSGRVDLVARAPDGKEVGRLPSAAVELPSTHRAFDLAALVPETVHHVELRRGEELLLPPFKLHLDALKSKLQANEYASVGHAFALAGIA